MVVFMLMTSLKSDQLITHLQTEISLSGIKKHELYQMCLTIPKSV